MSKGSAKPTPPPLDDGEKVAAGDASVPHAESGKATPEDAQRAAADARLAATKGIDPSDVAAARTAPAPATPEVTAAANALAAGTAIPAEPVDVDGREPAVLIADSGGQVIARPNPQVPLDPKADLVLGNWFGHVKRGNDLVQVHVKHGTLFAELPREVQKAIRGTKGVQVGPMPPKLPPNPFQP
jgi:hypothetical protein